MLFSVVLAVATAVAALLLGGRSDRRSTARIGLGVALAVAGFTHFLNPTPFEQHLPPWMPAIGLVVVLSGVAEVALGIALVAQWPSGIVIGRTVAAFFVAVFPANAYVAVAGVDVDGQPGGIYPWIRLPFQILFIAWALWSTQPARTQGQPSTHGAMPPLPWATGPGFDRAGGADVETVVMASVLELQRRRDVLPFLIAALRLRRLFATSPGAIRLSLRAIPFRKTFWTVSQWASQADLDAYARHPIHIEIVRKYSPRMAGSTFAAWTEPSHPGPSWTRAHDEISEAMRAAQIADSVGM